MDLAKIRNKALQSRTDVPAVPVPQEMLPEIVPTQVLNDAVSETPPSLICTAVQTSSAGELSVAAAVSSAAALPVAKNVLRDPLEIIMAGRLAAGCYDELPINDDDTAGTFSDGNLEFLCFRVADEIYGINIMDIKEIIKPREVTEVPRAPAFVSGILSLRGTIITVIDMRVRLGLFREAAGGKERVVVVRNGESLCGLQVDEVIQVVRVDSAAVEPAPAVLDGIDRDFVSGIGRSGGKLIIILNLEKIADIHLY